MRIKTTEKTIEYKDPVIVSGRAFSSRIIYELEIESNNETLLSELSLIKELHTSTYQEALQSYQHEIQSFESWGTQVRYPIELALFNQSRPQCQHGSIMVNGYFDPSSPTTIDLIDCLKIKVGRQGLKQDLEVLKKVEDKRLRLDANLSLTEEDFKSYLPHIFHYDYFEEPFKNPELIINFSEHRFALDENVDNKKLNELKQVVAYVLKPSVLGLPKTMELIEKAKILGKRVIISSTFEGEIGHLELSKLALFVDDYLGAREVHGLGTIGLLSQKLRHLGISVVNKQIQLNF